MKRRTLYILALLFAGLQTFAQTYTYDNLNRLTKVVYENGTTVTYTYDALGNRTKKKVTSNSVTDEFTISVTALPVQGGTVSGGGTYASGTVIELLATPNAGYEFVEWSDGVTANPRTVTVTSDMNFTAQFLATGFTTDYAQKVILYMRNNRVYEYGVPELTDISFNDRKQQLTVNKTNNLQDEYSVLLMDSIAFVDGEGNERHQFFSYEANGVRYSLYKKPNLDIQQPNADGWEFYKSELTLDITKNGTTTTYVVDDDIYLAEETNNANYPLCLAIDLNARMLYVFSNSKTLSRNYTMDGYAYVSSLDNISFQKETVFTSKNWGWYPYFTFENGTLAVQHFSFAGYYTMTSTRNNAGSWNTQTVGSINPDTFASQKYSNGFVLVIGTDNGSGDIIEHDYVDLGLPSGTLWATCNVGANSPEAYGDYFAWGETEAKEDYSWGTYKWMNEGQSNSLEINKYTFADGKTKACWYNDGAFIGDGKTELEPTDDAATVNWGSDWQMPSYDQLAELLNENYTTITWTEENGVVGRRITSLSNSNSIFLPATGQYEGLSLNVAGDYGYYWSRSFHTTYSYMAQFLVFTSDFIRPSGNSRYYGRCVRPVRVQKKVNEHEYVEIGGLK